MCRELNGKFNPQPHSLRAQLKRATEAGEKERKTKSSPPPVAHAIVIPSAAQQCVVTSAARIRRTRVKTTFNAFFHQHRQWANAVSAREQRMCVFVSLLEEMERALLELNVTSTRDNVVDNITVILLCI